VNFRHGIYFVETLLKMNALKRRYFLGLLLNAIYLPLLTACNPSPNNPREKRMILSFFLDDTNPQDADAAAFLEFINYCNTYGIKGESSFIPAASGNSIIRAHDQNDAKFIEYVKLAWSKGIDTHMELMTHNTLFNFETGFRIDNDVHEGPWLYEPLVTLNEYQKYFSNIIEEADKVGVKYTGLTWPGCGYDVCIKRFAELKAEGNLKINQAAYEALLNLAKNDKFRGRVVSIFHEANENNFGIFRKAVDGKYGVYDLMPNALDYFGIWENSIEMVNPDYYITEDGKSGIIIKHLQNNEPYCMWHMHWQGLNPGNGVGWQAFKKVTGRIRQHLSDKVIWMRPSDIVRAYHDANGWGFAANV